MRNVEIDMFIARENQIRLYSSATIERQATRLAPQPTSIVRQGARIIGRTLINIGARLLRYGRSSLPTTNYRANV